MKNETLTGEVAEFQGKPLAKAIAYSATVELFENVAEIKQSEEWPSDSEILKMVNNKRKTAAKASAYQKATEDLRNAYNDSPEKKRKDFISAAIAAGMPEDKANALADSMPGLKVA